jgi:YVTN family beta-propeller protein
MSAKQTIEFLIEKIITPANVTADKYSVVRVQVNKFAGFDDQVFRFHLHKKKAKASINFVSIDKERIKLGEDVRLSWGSSLAKRVVISYLDRDNKPVVYDSALPSGDQMKIELDGKEFLLPVKPTAEKTAIIGTGYDIAQSELTKDAHVFVEQRQADITRFSADKQLVIEGGSTKVTFSWEVQDAKRLILKKGTTEKDVTGATSAEETVTTAGEYSLLAYSYGESFPHPTTKALKIFSHRAPHGIVQPPLSGERAKRPTIQLNNHPIQKRAFVQFMAKPARLSKIYEINTDTATLVTWHEGSCFALHPSGNKMAFYVAGMTQRGIILYDITLHAKAIVPTNDDLVETMRFSPDGRKLFVGFEAGAFAGTGDDAENDVNAPSDAQRFATYYDCDPDRNTLTKGCGNTPIGMGEVTDIAFDGNNDKVYYTSYMRRNTDASLYVIRYDNGEKATPEKLDTQHTWPIMLKEAKKLHKIFGAFQHTLSIFQDANSVVVVNTDNSTVSANIPAGEYPIDMVLAPDEKTLYVACIMANKVVAIDTETAAVRTICNVDTPSCIAISSDGETLFAGGYRNRTVTLVDIKKAEVYGSVTLGTDNGNPYGIAITETATGYNVFVAKDGSRLIHPPGPNPDNVNLEITQVSIKKP